MQAPCTRTVREPWRMNVDATSGFVRGHIAPCIEEKRT